MKPEFDLHFRWGTGFGRHYTMSPLCADSLGKYRFGGTNVAAGCPLNCQMRGRLTNQSKNVASRPC